VGRIDPEVAVELLDDDGEWRRGFAYHRQRLGDGWWYHVRLHWPITMTAAVVRALARSSAQAEGVRARKFR
jgi:hypothetical protein